MVATLVWNFHKLINMLLVILYQEKKTTHICWNVLKKQLINSGILPQEIQLLQETNKYPQSGFPSHHLLKATMSYNLQTKQTIEISQRGKRAKQANKISQRTRENCNQVTLLIWCSNTLITNSITCRASSLKIQETTSKMAKRD